MRRLLTSSILAKPCGTPASPGRGVMVCCTGWSGRCRHPNNTHAKKSMHMPMVTQKAELEYKVQSRTSSKCGCCIHVQLFSRQVFGWGE